jgi:oligopeptide transport system substrate-binding protein
MGLSDSDGKEFYMNANLSEDGTYGYYRTDRESLEGNYAKAIETLKKYYSYDEKTKKFTNAPTITYLYNTSDAHRAIGEYMQSKFAGIGISLKLENQEWATFLNSRKNGDYDLARNGWVADFNDPITFLDMWVSESGNNDIGFGTGEHASLRIYDLDLTMLGYSVKIGNETWKNTYDRLIRIIKEETDIEKRYKLMHVAEDMLMDTGCIVPLYYYTDVYMIDNSVEGFFTNPLGYKFFMFCTVR